MTRLQHVPPVGSGEYLEGHLHQHLAEDPRVSDQSIGVLVTDAEIFLTGVVGTAERREAVSAVAAEYAGPRVVHNEVTVAAFPEPAAGEARS